ncbi:MAG TPA: TonB-dependent receptor, partial [Firmicutes bacterium]|nr:TonB-dependent receptor [Bacillota bacterium]
ENYLGRAGIELGENWRVSGGGGYSFILGYNPGPEGENWARDREAFETIQRSADISLDNEHGKFSGKLMFFADSGHNRFLETAAPMGAPMPGSYNTYDNYGIRIFQDIKVFEGNETRVGFDWQRFSGTFENFPPMPAMKKNMEFEEHDAAPYAVIKQKTGNVSVSAGIRYMFNNEWGGAFLPEFGVKAGIFERLGLFANFSTGYKTPAAGSLVFSDYEDLVPEDYRQYEAGLFSEKEGKYKITLSFYQIEGANIYRTDPIDGKIKSTGAIMMRGVEAEAYMNMGDNVRVGISGSYADPREKTFAHSFIKGSAYIEADIFEKITVRAETQTARDRFDSDNRENPLEDITVFNLGISKAEKGKGYERRMYVDIENLFDSKYEITEGYPVPGIFIKAGMDIKL